MLLFEKNLLEGVRYVPGRPVLVTPARVFLRLKPFFDASSRCDVFLMIRTYVSIRQIEICYIANIQYLVFMRFISLYLAKIKVLID